MAVEEGFLPVGISGKNLDTTVVTQDSGTETHREAVFIADPEDVDARLAVAKDKQDDYAIKVKSDTSTSDETLQSINMQLTLLNARFEEAFRTGITLEDI